MARLRLSFACDERWASMRRTSGGGRFCERCEKRLVDFTRMSEDEALRLVALFPPGRLCGRIPTKLPRAPSPTIPAALACAVAIAGCSVPTPPIAPDNPPPKSATAATTTTANLDADADGLLDVDDKCPKDAEDKDGFEDDDGCPDPDNDKDAILDVADKCPNEPENYNGYDDDDGCPDRSLGIIVTDVKVTMTAVAFAADSSKLDPAAFPILDSIATTLLAHPEFSAVLVRGHAIAGEKSAPSLAKARADAVLAALIARGVSAKTLTVQALAPAPKGADPAVERVVDFDLGPTACPP
jgi:outer membrane protein OmpA-like peptidoglycan-associated protein